jgi:NADPH-dependent ferric siderophore reductase
MTTEHLLLVGDDRDLSTIRELVEGVPGPVYGQVFIELAPRIPVPAWEPPAGVSVTWLRRDIMRGVLGGVAPHGELAARALVAWVAEWLPDAGTDRELPFIVWVGCSASHQMDRLYAHLEQRFENLHLHHPHG